MADFLKDIIIDGQLQTNERIYTLGGIRITGGIYDQNNSIGTAGQLLTSDGTNVEWVNTSQILGTQSNVNYYDVKNTTGATISKGKVVMAVGTDGNSGHILIDEMVADGSVEPRYILGVLNEDIAHGATGQAISLGQIKQLNTTGQNGETWSDGTVLWCDPNSPGDLTQTEPNGPNLKIPVAIVLNAATNGKIQVRVQANEGIHDLYDTKIASQVDGDILVWDNTTGVWFNDSTLNVDYTNNRVGIGTATPSEKLDVVGNIELSGNVIDASSAAYYLDLNGTSQLNHGYFFSTLSFGSFSAGTRGTQLEGYSTHSVVRTDSDRLDFYMGKSPGGVGTMMSLTKEGKVGIDETNPSEKLEVNGNIKLTETAATVDTDKFVVLDSGVLKYRTGANVLSDIGAAPSSHNHDDRYYTETEADNRFVNVTGDTMTGDLNIGANLSLTGDSRILNLAGGSTTSSQSRVIIGEQGTYGVSFRWNSSAELEFDGFWNSSVTGSRNRDLGSIDVNNRVWYLNNNVTVGNDLTVSGGDIILSGTGRIQGIDTVSAGTDAVNKNYVDTNFASVSHNHDADYVNVTGDTMTGALTASGGINGLTLANGISGSNFNITGVNQLSINDPGEGILFGGGANNVTLYAIDDSTDNKMNFGGASELQVNGSKVFHDGYHPNADTWTTARTITIGNTGKSVNGSANISWSLAEIGAAASSHNHDDRYYTESESDNRFTSIDDFRHTGNGYYTSTTTSALLTEALGDNAFDSKLSAHKTGWSYAGNGDLTDAGRLTELAGTSWLWWTDNSADNVQGNVTALCIAPTTGGSAGKMFVYNNQGSGYSPGWREIWTSTSDGSGSGLDADLLDGQHASAFAASSHTHTWADISGETANSVNSWGGLRHQTNDGYIDFGPANSNYAHIYTDKPSFYFNKSLVVNGSSRINTSDIRATIFYDTDNTSYYTNPSGVSTINDLTTAGFFQQPTNNEYFVTSGKEVSSVNDAWTMNISTSKNVGLQTFRFQNAVTGAPSTNDNANWGINIYSHSGGGGSYPYGLQLAGGNNDNQALYLRRFSNGSAQAWRRVFHEGSSDVRSPIFYDSNDTNYYGNFAGNSRYNTAQGNYLGLGVAANTSGIYRLNMGGAIDMNANDINYVSQLHFNDNVRFIDDGNDSYLNFKYGDANYGGIRFRRGDNSQKGYLYADDGGFGLLDSDGAWAVRTQTGTLPLELRCDGNTEFQVYNSFTLSPGSSRAPIFYDSNNTSYYLDPSSTGDSIRVAGDVVAYYSSDKRLKDNIKPIENALDKVNAISGVTFEWNDKSHKTTGKKDVGVVAQQVEEVFPEIVETRTNGYKAVDYQKLTAVLIESVKELTAKVEALEAKQCNCK